MWYAGGKERISKAVTQQLLALRRPEHDTYIEPFCGGANILSIMAPHFPKVLAADLHPDLILMWQALQEGWIPPENVSEEEYETLRFAPPSALRGFVGFSLSFGGSWFSSYAAKGGPLNHRSVLRQSESMRHVRFLQADYRSLRQVSSKCLVYCDPPYFATSGYKSGTRHFDSAEFWNHVAGWAAQGATVAVSEYRAPAGAQEIWSGTKRVTLGVSNSKLAVDRLFLVPTPVAQEV